MRKILWIGGALCGLCGVAAAQIEFSQAQAPEKEARQAPEKGKNRPQPNDPPPPAPPKKNGPRRGDEGTTTVRGIVKSFHESPKGDVDGLALEDGTEVRFPPHLGKQVTEIVALKDEIQIDGHKHTGPKGDTHLRADGIKNLKSDKSLAIDSPPPKDQEMLNEIRAIRALLDSQPPARSDVKDEPFEGGPHDRVLHELRELRKLVEQRIAKDNK
jgi:hypothetical protein